MSTVEIAAEHGEAIADAFANAILTKIIPPDTRLGQVISVQGVIQRGANGTTFVKTNPITVRVTDRWQRRCQNYQLR